LKLHGRKRSVRATLFSSYLLLIVLSTAFVTVFSSLSTANALKSQAIKSLRDLSAKLIDTLDAELFKMSAVSADIASSELMKQLLREREALPAAGRNAPGGPEARLQEYRNTVRIVGVMQSIIGPYKPVPQVNLYDLRGGMVGAGVFSQSALMSVFETPWLGAIDLHSGTARFSLPHQDPLLGRTFTLYQGASYISVYRTFFDELRSPAGVLEVKQFTNTIFRGMATESSRVSVYAASGMRLYPGEGGAPVTPEVRAAADGGILTLRDPETGRTEIAIVALSEQSGWRVMVSQEQGLLLLPVRRFTLIVLAFGLVLLTASVLVASRLSTRLTVPLRRMHDAVSRLDWEGVTQGTAARPTADLNELEELELAFQGMQAKLKESLEAALEARAHEMQATLLALQSQMDPHFVYNMLTTIGIMAEEGMTREIAESVGNLTHLLRYISSGKSSVVSIGEEVEYAARYLACMKVRFRENLQTDIRVPPGMLAIRVPKLIVQPVIENAMKYGVSGKPPWRVSICGETEGGRWTVTVHDNGPGFPAGRLAELEAQIGARMRSIPDPALSISGLGLLNIASRLRLFYGDEAVYKLENHPEGGASITIGGAHEAKTGVLDPGR
jgi:two-component system, sensor histidine kinase YesM